MMIMESYEVSYIFLNYQIIQSPTEIKLHVVPYGWDGQCQLFYRTRTIENSI